MTFQIHLQFFGSFMINFGSETCIFTSMICTHWILFSIHFGHYFAQFRSETAIMRAKFNDFPTSSAFFGSFMINFVSGTCVFISLIYTGWNCFQSFWVIMLFNSDLKLPLWEQSLMLFQLHLPFFRIFHDQFWVWNMYFEILDLFGLNIVFNPFGSLFCSIQIWNCHYESRIQWFSYFICIFWIFHDQFCVWNMCFYILDIYQLDIVFNLFGSLFCSI